MKPKLLIISGPTASGKTKLALKLAREFNGELLSADSRQVYRGMDVVTGKDLPMNAKYVSKNSLCSKGELKRSIREGFTNTGKSSCHAIAWRPSLSKEGLVYGYYVIEETRLWGLGIVKPDQDFDVSHFIKYAQVVIADICKRGKLPIIVGGTGFWIRSLLNQPETVGVPINAKLRLGLAAYNLPKLQQTLQKTDLEKWEGMNNSDRNNPRRLVRAIEIGEYINTKSEIRNPKQIKNKQISNIDIETSPTEAQLSECVLNYEDIFWIGLKMDKDILAEKIRQRVLERIKDGAVEETKKLAEKYRWDIPSMTGIGYRDLLPYIEDKLTYDQAVENWILHEIQYAKRQMTWNNREKQIQWFDVQDGYFFDRIKSSIQTCFYTTRSHE